MSRVLMSDSAALFQMLEPSFLKRGGWAIARASNPESLLESARRSRPDLIVLDSESFQDDLHPHLGALKADPALRSIPVVTISDPAGAILCRSAGADAAISRPVDPAGLVSLLCSLAHVAGRREGRSAAHVGARIDTASGHLRGRVKDIGPGGLFLALTKPLPMREEIAIDLRLPSAGSRVRVRARGIVVRQVFADRDSHLIPGVGVRFTEVDEPDRRLISTFVAASAGEPEHPDEAPWAPVAT